MFRHADAVCLCLCVHPVAVLNAAFLLIRVDDARGILQNLSHECFIGSHECLFLFTPSCCCECFYNL